MKTNAAPWTEEECFGLGSQKDTSCERSFLYKSVRAGSFAKELKLNQLRNPNDVKALLEEPNAMTQKFHAYAVWGLTNLTIRWKCANPGDV